MGTLPGGGARAAPARPPRGGGPRGGAAAGGGRGGVGRFGGCLVACVMPEGSVCRSPRGEERHRAAPSTSLLDASRTMAKIRVRGARGGQREMRKR